MSEQELNEWQAFERLFRLPVAEVREIADRCHRPARNHRKRCEAIASDLPPDWKPASFEQYLDGWIGQIFGR